MNWDEAIYEKKASVSLKSAGVKSGDGTRQVIKSKKLFGENFRYRRSLEVEQLLEEIKNGEVFGYIQCDIEVPEIARAEFANFPPNFKNFSVSKIDIGDLLKTYAEEEVMLS